MDVVAQLTEWPVPAPIPGSVQAFMARFSEGSDHVRRRSIVERRLSEVDPAALRLSAMQRTADIVGDSLEIDVMRELARTVPVAVLAAALGVRDVEAAVAATRRLALALAPPEGAEPASGWPEVHELSLLLGVAANTPDEEALNIVGILFQAIDATAGLVGNVLRAGKNEPAVTVVRTFRVSPDALQTVDLTAADPPLPFGAGPHRCPGEPHARALAAGVLDALDAAGAVVIDAPDLDEPRLNLRIPIRVIVRLHQTGNR